VADTVLSDVDGERGELWIRGEPVERLAERHAFAEVLGLLTTGGLPEPPAGRQRRVLHRGPAGSDRAFRATLFSAMFAASRVVGWCAHVAEQRASGRLIRPASRYVGARVTHPARAAG
jgi:citrate synthase